MRIVVEISRVLVGVLFIISGWIKLNDPVGFSFKLEEYFSPAVLDIPSLMPLSLAISLSVVILEVILGIMLLLGYKRNLTVWSLLLMILFFTFLTFYSAYYNKVTDCGCFGDAIKLTPWESFTKDVVLLVLILLLFYGRAYIKPLFNLKGTRAIVLVGLLSCCVFAYYVLHHLPVVDFRPYHEGANIPEGMAIPDDAPEPIYEYAWRFNEGGREKIVVTLGDYPQVEGEFLGVETKEIQKGYEPPIHDFTIEKDGIDQAGQFLQEDKLMMVVAYDLGRTKESAFTEIKNVSARALEAGFTVIGLSASGEERTVRLRRDHELAFPFYFTDETTLKTIVRSNPGVLLLRRGTIVQKVHYKDLDELSFH